MLGHVFAFFLTRLQTKSEFWNVGAFLKYVIVVMKRKVDSTELFIAVRLSNR